MPIDNDQLLKEEYFQLQKTVEDFDGRTLTIKAWSVSLGAAGLAGWAVSENRLVLVAAMLSALGFWFVDWMWKMHQQAFYPRIEAIERAFASGAVGPPKAVAEGAAADARNDPPRAATGKTIEPLQILTGWRQSFDVGGLWYRGFRTFWYPVVFLPHIIVMAIAIAALCISLGKEKEGKKEKPAAEVSVKAEFKLP